MIEPNFSIKRVPRELKDYAQLDEQGTSILSRIDKDTIAKCNWCFAFNYEDPSIENQSDENVHQRDENRKQARESMWRFALIAALKFHYYLFAPFRCQSDQELKDIWFLEPQETPPNDLPEIIHAGQGFWENDTKKVNLETTRKIYLNVNQELDLAGDTQQKLRNALMTTREAFQKRNIANQLLSFTISLENLFNDGRGDVRHKICTRTARFVRDSYKDRIEVYNEMKEVYDCRSQISHGDLNYNALKHVKSLKKSHLLVRKWVCAVLTKFLETKKLWSVFNSEDDWIEFLRRLDLG